MTEKFVLFEPYADGSPVEVNSAQYQKLFNAQNVLSRLGELEETFELFARSYLRIESTIFDIELNFLFPREKPKNTADLFGDAREKLNLDLLTFLSASSVVIEKGDQLAKNAVVRGFSTTEFEPIRTGIFDQNLEYRVMCGLRNFVLHNKLPLGNLQLSTKLETGSSRPSPEELSRLRITCNPTFRAADLVSDDVMRSATRKEIKDTGAEGLDVKYFVRRFVELVTERQIRIRELTKDGCDNALSEFRKALDILKKKNNREPQLLSIQIENRKTSELEDLIINPRRYEKIINRREAWESLKNAAGSYISSEVNQQPKVYSVDPPTYYFPQ